MPEYSEEEALYAQRIAVSLLGGEPGPRDLDPGFSIEDVEGDVVRFADDLDFLAWVGEDIPALEVANGPPVPMSLSLVLPFLRLRDRRYRLSPYYWRDAFRRRSRIPSDGVTYLRPDEARENFQLRLVDFLANRLAAVRRKRRKGYHDDSPQAETYLHLPQYSGGPSTHVPGCNFSVFTQSSGLTAYWSGAYYVSHNYHGAPTSPTFAPLQAGTYIFGVDGGAYGSVIRWDRNKVCTLPGVPSVQLPF